MKSIAIFILFLGTVLVIQGYYSDLAYTNESPKTQIKFVPRSQYEEQLSTNNELNKYYKSIFDEPNVQK